MGWAVRVKNREGERKKGKGKDVRFNKVLGWNGNDKGLCGMNEWVGNWAYGLGGRGLLGT